MIATLHERRLTKRDDRGSADPGASLVNGVHVVALVERHCLGLNALADALQEIVGKARFVRSRRLDARETVQPDE